jgi:hypothetical protein
MYVCLSHSARREEAAAYWVLHGSLETMQGLAGVNDTPGGQRGARADKRWHYCGARVLKC